MDIRKKLTELLTDYFHIGDSYHYILKRVKEAFHIGTLGLDDFEEYDEDTVAEIVEHLIAAGVTIPVMCKDCKFFHKVGDESSKGCAWGNCRKHSTPFVYANEFCSRGERRDKDAVD